MEERRNDKRKIRRDREEKQRIGERRNVKGSANRKEKARESKRYRIVHKESKQKGTERE